MPACAPEIGTRSLAGSLALRAVADGSGITRIVEIERCPPMQVQRPLYLDAAHPGVATVQIINATAGLFAGDDLRLRIDVSSGARLAVSTPAMTRVYTMPRDATATGRVELRVRADAYLEYLPAPTMLCRDAELQEEKRIDIDAEAHAAIGEVWAFGRVAHGELHAYRELHARTELYCGGALVLADALVLKPSEASPGPSVGRYAAYGALTLAGPRVDAALLARVRGVLDEGHRQIVAGASTLSREGGVAVRVLGASAHSVHATLQGVIAEFRQYVLDAERSPISAGRTDHAWRGVR